MKQISMKGNAIKGNSVKDNAIKKDSMKEIVMKGKFMKETAMKKIISIVLSLALALSLASAPAFAAENSADRLVYFANNEAYSVLSGTTAFHAMLTDKESAVNYYYSDGYFAAEDNVYNPHLASFSCISLNKFRPNTFSSYKSLMKSCGFDNFYEAYRNTNGEARNGIGVAISEKELCCFDGSRTGKHVIAITIRSFEYEVEWGSNFLVGLTGDAKGFGDSANLVVKEIKKYISNNDLSD